MLPQTAASREVEKGARFITLLGVTDDLTPVEKLHAAFDLFEAGVDLQRQNLRRAHPGASDDDVAANLQDWLLARPGADHREFQGMASRARGPSGVNRLASGLRAAGAELKRAGLAYAVVGGLAVSARTEPRFTRGVDLAVMVENDREAADFAHGLLQRGWRILAQVEQDVADRLATLRAVPPGADEPSRVVVDFLFASSGIEPEIVRAAEHLEVFAGVVTPVATAVHLVAMKVLAMDDRTRPQDRTDAITLLRTLSPPEIDSVRIALRDVEPRGYHRNRDLQRELDRLLPV